MEAHQQFNKILFRWFRFIGVLLGHNIFQRDFKLNNHTIVGVIIGILPVICVIWSCLYRDREAALNAACFLFFMIKVQKDFFL